MNNVKLNYLYRDASNFKNFASVVFLNPSGMNLLAVSKSLEDAFWVDGLFIANQIRVPEVFLFAKCDISIDDDCFHEFLSVESTQQGPTDTRRRSIDEFVAEVVKEAKRGWKVFDPLERLSV
jgi:hypothetical protein